MDKARKIEEAYVDGNGNVDVERRGCVCIRVREIWRDIGIGIG